MALGPTAEADLDASASATAVRQGLAPRWLAPALVGLVVFINMVTVALALVAPPGRNTSVGLTAAPYAIAWTVFATMGALIIARQPHNRIGRLLFTLGFVTTVLALLAGSGEWALASGPAPLGVTLVWVTHWLQAVATAPIVFVMLLFPDGRLLGPGFALPAGLALLGAIAVGPALALSPMSLIGQPGIANPYALGGPAGAVALTAAAVSLALLGAGLAGGVVSLVVRFRRSRDDERRQLKWVAAAASLSIPAMAVVLATSSGPGQPSQAGHFAASLAFAAIALAIGVAVLRFRLYDIDVIVNRALVYLPLLGILGGLYAAGVALFQRLFVTLTGDTSDGAVIITTLLLASAFTPLRKILEAAVDRRFRPDRTPTAELSAELARRVDEVARDAARAEVRRELEQRGR